MARPPSSGAAGAPGGLVAALFAAACGTSTRPPEARTVVEAIAKSDLQRLATKRVYFAHQSVGFNIVDGLTSLAKERPELALKIAQTRRPEDFSGPLLGHSEVGENRQPLGKIEDFSATLLGGLGATTDVALLKFCYIDFDAGTDIPGVFAAYQAAVAKIKAQFPRLTLVHVTAPLSVIQGGPKGLVKSLIGKKRWGVDENIARNRFNQLMRDAYQGREPLFDLAAAESLRSDGTNATFTEQGRTYAMLAPELASDGEHLNDAGGRWVAAHLLKTLAALPN